MSTMRLPDGERTGLRIVVARGAVTLGALGELLLLSRGEVNLKCRFKVSFSHTKIKVATKSICRFYIGHQIAIMLYLYSLI